MDITNKFGMIQSDKKCDDSLRYCMNHMLDFVKKEFPFGHMLELNYFDLCYYNVSDDHQFLFDYIPGYHKAIAVAGAGSGHSFKFAPIIGKVVRECLNNANAFDGRFEWKYRPKIHFFGSEAQTKAEPLQSKL